MYIWPHKSRPLGYQLPVGKPPVCGGPIHKFDNTVACMLLYVESVASLISNGFMYGNETEYFNPQYRNSRSLPISSAKKLSN